MKNKIELSSGRRERFEDNSGTIFGKLWLPFGTPSPSRSKSLLGGLEKRIGLGTVNILRLAKSLVPERSHIHRDSSFKLPRLLRRAGNLDDRLTRKVAAISESEKQFRKKFSILAGLDLPGRAPIMGVS